MLLRWVVFTCVANAAGMAVKLTMNAIANIRASLFTWLLLVLVALRR
jgi:hypothetical protein